MVPLASAKFVRESDYHMVTGGVCQSTNKYCGTFAVGGAIGGCAPGHTQQLPVGVSVRGILNAFTHKLMQLVRIIEIRCINELCRAHYGINNRPGQSVIIHIVNHDAAINRSKINHFSGNCRALK
jgi:hypothetical protein